MRDSKGRFVKGSKGHLGHKHTEETKKKLSIFNKGKVAWNKGIKKTLEQKKQMSEAHHINGNKLDNRIENLACIPQDYHKHIHWEYEKQNNINRFGGN